VGASVAVDVVSDVSASVDVDVISDAGASVAVDVASDMDVSVAVDVVSDAGVSVAVDVSSDVGVSVVADVASEEGASDGACFSSSVAVGVASLTCASTIGVFWVPCAVASSAGIMTRQLNSIRTQSSNVPILDNFLFCFININLL